MEIVTSLILSFQPFVYPRHHFPTHLMSSRRARSLISLPFPRTICVVPALTTPRRHVKGDCCFFSLPLIPPADSLQFALTATVSPHPLINLPTVSLPVLLSPQHLHHLPTFFF